MFHCDSAQAEIHWLAANTRARDPNPRVLICHYREPAVIFGLSQPPDRALQQRLETAGVSWVRRRSGGGIVYAGPWMLGVSLILPANHPLGAMEPVPAYGWFGGLWQDMLAQLGVDSSLPDRETILASRREAESRDIDWACYAAMGHGELGSSERATRKILGIAQIRTRAASTLVAGLHLDRADWRALCALLGKPQEQGEHLARINASLMELVPARGSTATASLAAGVEETFLPLVRQALDCENPGHACR
ncbi:lipoyl protein ligase domain-containing protein [Chromatocurvus halotolerans]|uniref:lipoyl protein ligase domain-containing protein n=1 Tax=Chromatocurvus halotolerans TaxID=1132028 RepID=UPI00104BD4A9|nr:hypothetical protein [Chromatocurvus halotolerans]